MLDKVEKLLDRFTWKTGWETKLSGLTKTVLYTRESVFQTRRLLL